MAIKATKKYFVKDGKPFFLISGEIHYFRIVPSLWEKHLRLLKKSGVNTTSTYIPWDWHEYEEGKFDFTGNTHPAKNLVKYIELCKKIGLNLIVKPGPYVLAEYENHGLPWWLVNKKENIHALDENGKVISSDLMTYMSDAFLKYAFHWYDKIMPIIQNYQESSGGPITALQVCNEVGVFQWLSGKIDYNPVVIDFYKRFLLEKYKSIENLNNVYRSTYISFNEINPPKGKIENERQYVEYVDFHLFFRKYYAIYLNTLIKKIRSFGIGVLLTHNIPGWIYGNASELPMLISTYEEIMRSNKDIIFGLDHIPEFFSFRNAHSDLASNKIIKAMQQNCPVWAAEFQAGTREHFVKCDANDLESFYWASLSHGIRGFNYYMFSQGLNPDGKGFYGKTFYYQTPLNSNGDKSKLYESIKKVNSFIKSEKDEFLSSETTADICIGLYKPYYHTELISSQLLKGRKLDVGKLGLSFDPRFIREEVFFNGLLRGLQTLNFNYDIYDLENHEVNNLLKYKQLWVITTDLMDDETQRFLAAYVNEGGHLIIYPTIPILDLYLNKCLILKDRLNIKSEKRNSLNKVDVLGIKDLYTFNSEKEIFKISLEEAIAVTKKNEVCGIHKQVGKGSVTTFGFAFGYLSDEHLHLYEKIISLNKIKRQAEVSDPDIQFVVHKRKTKSYIFLLNYHNQKKTFLVDSQKVVLNPFSCTIIKRSRKKK